MAENWHRIGLSAHLLAISTAAAELRTAFQAASFEAGHAQLATLESEIAKLRAASALRNVEDAHFSPDSSPEVQELTQDALDTLWDELPTLAVAQAHKEAADNLARQGNPNGDSTRHIRDVYRAYAKYLLLYPHRDDTEYLDILKRVAILEEQLAGTAPITIPLFVVPPTSGSSATTVAASNTPAAGATRFSFHWLVGKLRRPSQ
ncbi:hypothetical protein C8J57DRAFT_1336043 [Mycena rebaudengoi]|nr:hypothetical protein C8J57DRAFT_1336043 [Mycena rebaudengoi]